MNEHRVQAKGVLRRKGRESPGGKYEPSVQDYPSGGCTLQGVRKIFSEKMKMKKS